MHSGLDDFDEQVNLENTNQPNLPGTFTTDEDFSDLDMITCANLDSLTLSMEVKMKANNDTILDQIQTLLGGISSTPASGLAEIASAFQPNATPPSLSRELQRNARRKSLTPGFPGA